MSIQFYKFESGLYISDVELARPRLKFQQYIPMGFLLNYRVILIPFGSYSIVQNSFLKMKCVTCD